MRDFHFYFNNCFISIRDLTVLVGFKATCKLSKESLTLSITCPPPPSHLKAFVVRNKILAVFKWDKCKTQVAGASRLAWQSCDTRMRVFRSCLQALTSIIIRVRLYDYVYVGERIVSVFRVKSFVVIVSVEESYALFFVGQTFLNSIY